VFDAAGEARLGDARDGTITFPAGTIVLSHHAEHGSSQFDPRSCLSVISQSGTYEFVRGTGRYTGISGHGTRPHPRFYPQSGGCRSFHGRACSSCADREIRVPSSPIRPASMMPIGRPAAVQCSGTLTAGWPDTL
jgi:hypothetical protein